MQYAVSLQSIQLWDEKSLMRLKEHMREWADRGWRLISTEQFRVGVNGNVAEHYFYWEKTKE